MSWWEEDFQQESKYSPKKLEVTNSDETDTCLPASTGRLVPLCVRELGVNRIRRQM